MSQADQQPQAPAGDERTIELLVTVKHSKGQIHAKAEPTMNRFLVDELPRAGFHIIRAITNAIQEAIDRGPTEEA